MSGVCLATRGYICQGKGPVITTGPGPDLDTDSKKPGIMTRATGAPKNIVDTIPEVKPTIKPRRRRMRRAA